MRIVTPLLVAALASLDYVHATSQDEQTTTETMDTGAIDELDGADWAVNIAE